MLQSSYIAGALLVGFTVFVITRGEFPAYKAIIFDSGSPAMPAAAASAQAGDIAIPQPIAPVRTKTYTPADVGLDISQAALDALIANGTVIPPKQ